MIKPMYSRALPCLPVALVAYVVAWILGRSSSLVQDTNPLYGSAVLALVLPWAVLTFVGWVAFIDRDEAVKLAARWLVPWIGLYMAYTVWSGWLPLWWAAALWIVQAAMLWLAVQSRPDDSLRSARVRETLREYEDSETVKHGDKTDIAVQAASQRSTFLI